MKVLLMVEREGRVVMAKRIDPDAKYVGTVRDHAKAICSDLGGPRWWLVEAESAEHARDMVLGRVSRWQSGRILASGGKR